MAYKSLQDYCNELIAQGDPYGQQLLDEFGNGDGVYENEYGMWQAPSDYSYASNKKIDWKCEKGHQWEATLAHRTIGRRKCPYCYGTSTILKGENDLASQYKEIAKEWDYSVNGDLKPDQVRPSSGKKVGWICSKNHKWSAIISDRTMRNRGCPFCIAKSTSYPEQFLYWGLKAIYSNTESRVKLFKSEENPRGFEYDVYVPDLNLLIEYSGENWHDGKEERDQLKKELAISNGYQFIEIKELAGKNKEESFEKYNIKVCNGKVNVVKVLDFILNQFNHSINKLDLKEIESLAREYSKGKIEYEKSLEYLKKELIEEWDYENNSLNPSEVTLASTYKAHWICKNNHKWKASVHDRVGHNSGCPECNKLKMKARSRIPDLPTL